MSNLVDGRKILILKIFFSEKEFFFIVYSLYFNLYIVHEFTNNWPRNPTNNFPLTIGSVKLVRNAIKSKFICNGRRIAFDEEGYCNFGNDYARGVDNSSSPHTDNRKKNLVLGEGPTFGISGSHGAAENKY